MKHFEFALIGLLATILLFIVNLANLESEASSAAGSNFINVEVRVSRDYMVVKNISDCTYLGIHLQLNGMAPLGYQYVIGSELKPNREYLIDLSFFEKDGRSFPRWQRPTNVWVGSKKHDYIMLRLNSTGRQR